MVHQFIELGSQLKLPPSPLSLKLSGPGVCSFPLGISPLFLLRVEGLPVSQPVPLTPTLSGSSPGFPTSAHTSWLGCSVPLHGVHKGAVCFPLWGKSASQLPFLLCWNSKEPTSTHDPVWPGAYSFPTSHTQILFLVAPEMTHPCQDPWSKSTLFVHPASTVLQ